MADEMVTSNAQELKYASASSWTSGQARQGLHSSTRYEGAIKFEGMQIPRQQGIEVLRISLMLTFGKSGTSTGTKILNLYEAAKDTISGSIASMRGPLIGTISVQDAYNKSIELVFDKNTNSALFTKLKDYFITRNRLTLITYVPTTRAMSGKFCVDYLSITAASIVVNWGFTPTTCVFNNGNSSVKAGTTVNMTLTPANSNYTHTIVWKFGSITESQKVAAGVKTATKAIPQTWLNQIPNSQSGTATVTVQTELSGSKVAEATYMLQIIIPADISPRIPNQTISPVNTNSNINKWGMYVRGKTKAKIVAECNGQYGATVKSVTITSSPNIGSGTGTSQTTDVINVAGEVSITVRATDSRGITTSRTERITVSDYSRPGLESWAYRCDTSGNRNDVSGTSVYVKAIPHYTTLGNRNSVTIAVLVSKLGGSNVVQTTISPNTGVVLAKGQISTDSEYLVTFTVRDTVGSVMTQYQSIFSAQYMLHFKKGGKAIGIGMAAGDDNTISMGWRVFMSYPLSLTSGGTGVAIPDSSNSMYATRQAQACANIGALRVNGNAVSATKAKSADEATSAGKLKTSRQISLAGDVTGSGYFDGSANLSIQAKSRQKIDYSTSFENTGKKWIDGKAIYRSVVTLTTQGVNTTKTYSLPTTVGELISISGAFKNADGNQFPLPRAHSASARCVDVGVVTGSLRIITGNNIDIAKGYVIVEFTI